jgi:hypothetical protein
MWTIRGNRDSINFGVSKSGYKNITGRTLRHEVYTSSYYNPTGENEEVLKPWHEEKVLFNENLSKLELGWKILPGNATEADIAPADGNETSLFKRCQTEPEISHAFITYYDFTGDREIRFKDRIKSLDVEIVLPPEVFNRVWNLFSKIFTDSEIEYKVHIDCGDWMRQRRSDDSHGLCGKYKDSRLTMEEFLNGKDYYTNEIDFQIFRAKDHD